MMEQRLVYAIAIVGVAIFVAGYYCGLLAGLTASHHP